MSADSPVTAICPGTYDPVTNGHVDIIRRTAAIFDRVVVGVVREPSALGMTMGSPASSTLTTELVVPRSIPTALGMPRLLLSCDCVSWCWFADVVRVVAARSGCLLACGALVMVHLSDEL